MARPVERPNWEEWRYIPEVCVWQACALSLDIEPHSMTFRDTGWMAGPGFGPFFKDESFPGKAAKSEFESRQRILLANLGDKFFTACTIDMGTPGNNGVLLQEFALWAVDKLGWSVPLELLGLAEKERKAREDKARELEEQQEDEGFLASLEETIYNGKAISWRYWALLAPTEF